MFNENQNPEKFEMIKESFKKIVEALGAADLMLNPDLQLPRNQSIAELKKTEPDMTLFSDNLGKFWDAAESLTSEGSQIALSVITAGILYEGGRTEDAVEELTDVSNQLQQRQEGLENIEQMVDELISSIVS